MKRILHLIPSLGSGGAERQLTNLISNTTKSEFTHLVCTFKNSNFFAPAIRTAGYEVWKLEITGKHPWFSGTSKLLGVIRDYRPDIIKTWLYDANIIGRLAHLWNSEIPLITTLHAPDYEPDMIRASNWSPTKVEGLRQIDKLTARLTNPNFAACSHYVKKSFQKRLNLADSQIKVIYNGTDPEPLKCDKGDAQRIRHDLEIPADGFVYLTVGRIDVAKNHALLLRVFPQVLSAVPQAHLVIVGTGVLEQELKGLAGTLGISRRVHFLGMRNDIAACLEMADVFVFPTLAEGFGLALVEAMFKQLPCVASNIEALREVLIDNETGLLFNPNDPDELVEAMRKLFLEPELRQRLVRQALEDAERRFHIRRIASQWENFYNQVIDNENIRLAGI